MNILAELPAVVTRRLVVEWMDIVEVSRLDAAMFARFHPSALRTVLWSSQPAISSERGHPTSKENTESYMRWLLKRNIKVNCARLDNGCSRIALSEFLITCGNAVTEISLNQSCFGRDVADLVVNECPKLKAITVKSKKMRLVKLARAVYSEATVKKEVNQDRGITLLAHGCPHLVYVNLAFMDVTDTAIRTLCEKCPKVEYLDLHGCNLNGFTAHYEVLTQLLFLDLSHTQCTAVVVRSVAKCLTLRCLKLGHKMDDAVLAEITTHCPNLTDFAIPMWIGEPHACPITRASLEVFAQHHPKLRAYITPHLFSRIENVPYCVATSLAQSCPDLRDVDLTYCNSLHDDALVGLAQGCRQLRRLGVARTYISDTALIAIADNCQRLEMLIVRDCANITDEGIIAVAQGCRRLRHIDAEHCMQLTSRCATALAENCPRLKVARFQGCKRIYIYTLEKIFRRCECKVSLQTAKSENRKAVADYSIAAALLNA